MGSPPAGRSYEPFQAEPLRELIQEVFEPILDHYFRARLLGAAKIPPEGPLLLAVNHSGNAFPYDGMVLDALLWRRDGYRPEAKFRSVFEPALTLHWWMRPFGVDNFWRRCGGVDVTFDNLGRLLEGGERVIYYPEGVAGIGKGFGQRYRLQPFHTAFVAHCGRLGVPVQPVYIINAEWVIPFDFTIGWVDRAFQRVFGVPFLPLPGAPLGMLFPFLWYLSLPARMICVVGDPIDVGRMAREAGVSRYDPSEREALARVAERVRRRMQADLDRHAARYGRWPYQARSLRRAWARARGKRARILPTGWAAAWLRHERDRLRPPARGRLHALLRDWDLLGFYLPFGWPFLSLTRAGRCPPCGYRGLSPAERREQRGEFVWSLAERPLPPRRQAPPARPDAGAAPEAAARYLQPSRLQ